MLRGLAVLLAIASASSLSRADMVVTFDFEDQAAGPLAQGTTLTDAGTGLKISISRLVTFPALETAPFSFFNLSPFGVASFGMSLSPFNDPMAAIPFVINIDTSGLFGPATGMIVNRISWIMGDFIPSDLDIITVMTIAGGVPFSGTTGIPFDTSLGFFGFASYFAQRDDGAISQVQILGGSNPGFPNSLYFGQFTLNLSSAFAGSNQPESSAGGDPPTDATNGAGGAPQPVPEPATLALVGAAAALLARRRLR